MDTPTEFTVAINWSDESLYTSQMGDYARKLEGQGVFDANDYRTMAGILRIAEAENKPGYLDDASTADYLKKFEERLARQTDHVLGFEVANNLLQFTFDDSENWNLGGLTEARKKWCVDQLLGRLEEITDFSTADGKKVLKSIDSIATRTDAEQTLSGEPETFISSDELKPLESFFESRPEIYEMMVKNKNEEMRNKIDSFNTDIGE